MKTKKQNLNSYIQRTNIKTKNLKDAIKDRRTYYQIKKTSPISDEEIQSIIEYVLLYAPSSNSSQSARLGLLLGENHSKFWEITKDALKKVSKSEKAFKKTELKVDTSFEAGYCTVLFLEDQSVIKRL